MTPDSGLELAIPPSLAARIQTAAEEEHRSAIDILRDAMDLEVILAGTMDMQYDYLNAERE